MGRSQIFGKFHTKFINYKVSVVEDPKKSGYSVKITGIWEISAIFFTQIFRILRKFEHILYIILAKLIN